jgi:hypothetical protein
LEQKRRSPTAEAVAIQQSAASLPFDEWTSVFASKRLTGALLERLTHPVHILEMNGDSYQLKQSKHRPRADDQPTTPHPD